MNMKIGPWLMILACSLVPIHVGQAQEESPERALDPASLRFTDIRFLPRTLSELMPARALVVFVTGRSCPIVRRYLPLLVKMQEEYRSKGVVFLALNPVPGEGVIATAAQMTSVAAPFPFGKDFGGRTVRRLGLDRLGAVAVLDSRLRIVYRGRVDGRYRLSGASPRPSRQDLREALDDVLAGRPVRVPETPVDGCLIAQAPQPPARRVTWSEHVAPIIGRHCSTCHRPGGEAPFPLETFAQARASAGMIAEVVRQGRMPPWLADPEHGSFVNAPGLSSEERGILVDWVRSGMPRGEKKDVTSPGPSGPEWRIGEPDRILRAEEETELPAEGYVPYHFIILPEVFEEDTWVQAAEIRASNPKVMHHANLFYNLKGTPFSTEGFIMAQVPGGDVMNLPQGTAFLIPKGSYLCLSVHYVTTGRVERDRISVALRFPRTRVQRNLKYLTVANTSFAIPPGHPGFEVRAEGKLWTDADLLWIHPHMHLRGRDVTVGAVPPRGREEILLSVPSWSFDWQASYHLEPGTRILPKGTRITCVAHYDNSAFNPFNPDPSARVTYGFDTFHEMLYCFLAFTDPHQSLRIEVDPATGRVRRHR